MEMIDVESSAARRRGKMSTAMRLTITTLVTLAMLLWSGAAMAAATWSVSASMSDGSPLNAATLGAQLILDIGLTTDVPELNGISGSVNDYDNNMVSPRADLSSISSQVLCEFYNEMFGGCINGATNLESGLREQVGLEGPGPEDTFLSLLETSSATGTGAVDEPFPQFRIVYDVFGPGTTTLRIGTFADYADAYTIISGPGVVNNTAVSITVAPEPGTALLLGVGLAALSTTRRPSTRNRARN